MSKKSKIDSFIKSKGSLGKTVTIKVSDETKLRIENVNEFLDRKNLKIDMQNYIQNEINNFLDEAETHLSNEYPNEFSKL